MGRGVNKLYFNKLHRKSYVTSPLAQQTCYGNLKCDLGAITSEAAGLKPGI